MIPMIRREITDLIERWAATIEVKCDGDISLTLLDAIFCIFENDELCARACPRFVEVAKLARTNRIAQEVLTDGLSCGPLAKRELIASHLMNVTGDEHLSRETLSAIANFESSLNEKELNEINRIRAERKEQLGAVARE